MLKTQFIGQKKIKKTPYIFINIILALFPISIIAGSLIVNINLIIFCALGIYYLKSKILKFNFDFTFKIIFLFFVLIVFSTSLSFIKSLYFEDASDVHLARLIKSLLFLRFFLFLLIIFLLNKFNILSFKYFFMSAAGSAFIVSLDIIFQHSFGFNMIGLKGHDFYNSGFFGDELVAGGYIQRFSIFSILFSTLLFKNKNNFKFVFSVVVICVLGLGVFFAGNRMPLILFTLGLFFIFLLNIEVKKILFVSLLGLLIIFKFIISSDELYKSFLKNTFYSFYVNAKNVIALPSTLTVQKINKVKRIEGDSLKTKTDFVRPKYETHYRRLFLTAVDTWKENKIFGNGIKSFRLDCWKLEKDDKYYFGEDLMPGKKNRLCSNHPHNYYFEILTEAGILGILTTLILATIFTIFILKNLRLIQQVNAEKFILISALISLTLEMLPIRNTGSIFTTNNATYIILITSIIICHRTLIKNKM